MPLAVNDIVQMTVMGEKDSQTILNVFYFRCTVAPSTGTPADNISNLLNQLWEVDVGAWEIAWTAVMPGDYNLRGVRGQKINAPRGAYVEQLLIDNGEIVVNPSQTPNLAWVFVKQSEDGGRRGKGTTHMLIPSTDWYENGELTIDGATERLNLTSLVPNTVVVTAGGTYEPIIYHPNFSPNFSRITHCTIKQEVRVMRRRTVRVGE